MSGQLVEAPDPEMVDTEGGMVRLSGCRGKRRVGDVLRLESGEVLERQMITGG